MLLGEHVEDVAEALSSVAAAKLVSDVAMGRSLRAAASSQAALLVLMISQLARVGVGQYSPGWWPAPAWAASLQPNGPWLLAPLIGIIALGVAVISCSFTKWFDRSFAHVLLFFALAGAGVLAILHAMFLHDFNPAVLDLLWGVMQMGATYVAQELPPEVGQRENSMELLAMRGPMSSPPPSWRRVVAEWHVVKRMEYSHIQVLSRSSSCCWFWLFWLFCSS